MGVGRRSLEFRRQLFLQLVIEKVLRPVRGGIEMIHRQGKVPIDVGLPQPVPAHYAAGGRFAPRRESTTAIRFHGDESRPRKSPQGDREERCAPPPAGCQFFQPRARQRLPGMPLLLSKQRSQDIFRNDARRQLQAVPRARQQAVSR